MPPKLEKVEKVRQAIENMLEYLREKHGGHNAPLSYVVRDDPDVPDVDDDLPFREPTIDEELERRLPHEGSIFEADNALVWNTIFTVTHEGPAWAWVKQYNRTSNGRAAFLALKEHFMGTAFQNTVKLQADRDLETLHFNGNRNFTHDVYCEKMKHAIQTLEETGEELPVEKQIRMYLRGIQDPRLTAAVTTVHANNNLRDNLETCMNFISQQLSTIESYNDSSGRRSVADTYTGGGRGGGRSGGRGYGRDYRYAGPYGRGRGGGRGRGRGRGYGRGGRTGRGYREHGESEQEQSDIDISNRHYEDNEWEAMTSSQRQAVYEARERRQQGATGRMVWVPYNTQDLATQEPEQQPEQRQQSQQQTRLSQPQQSSEAVSQMTESTAMSHRPRGA